MVIKLFHIRWFACKWNRKSDGEICLVFLPTTSSIFSKVYLWFLFPHKFSFNYPHRFSLDLSYQHLVSTSVLSHITSCATKGVFIGTTLCGWRQFEKSPHTFKYQQLSRKIWKTLGGLSLPVATPLVTVQLSAWTITKTQTH